VKQVAPVNYNLEFEPDLARFRFRGREKIQVKIARPTRRIVLNAAELRIITCEVISGKERLKARAFLDERKEELAILLPRPVSGLAVISIDFEGVLNDKLVGFYRSRYEFKGKERYLATTQFEAADARRAFPCWDDPESKATFDVSLIVDVGLSAISNMPVSSKSKAGNKTAFRFDTTPVMSTYLLYMGVGDLNSLREGLEKRS